MRATVGNKHFGNFVPLARQRCVEDAAPYKLHAAKIARSSRADIIRPCTIVTICNIVMVVYHQHLHLQIPMPITHHNTKQRCPCISMDSVLLFENSANRESDLIWTLHSRISGEAAVDGENNAGYEAGLALVAEKQQSTRQILGHAEATQGSVGDYLVRARGERAVLVEE